MKDYLVTVLRESSFFRGISDASCRRLAALGRVQTPKRNAVLFREGEPGERLFLLERGAVQLFTTSPDGHDTVVRTVQPGEVFGEVILFEQNRYPVTATALAASRVFSFDRRDFRLLLDEASFRDEFIGMLMGRLRYLAGRLRHLTVYDVEDRFRLFLREQFGEQDVIETPISKKGIAAAIGTTPETLSRLVQRLKAEGQLAWHGKRLRLSPAFWRRLPE